MKATEPYRPPAHSCRLCRTPEYRSAHRLIKYGPRHWGCPPCLLKRFGRELFQKLPTWQLEKLPAMVIDEAGLFDELMAELNRRRAAEKKE